MAIGGVGRGVAFEEWQINLQIKWYTGKPVQTQTSQNNENYKKIMLTS